MSEKTRLVRTVSSLRSHVNKWKKLENTIALVPTMGALHEGHLSLVKQAVKKADKVVVTIFVNPTQFGKNEDLSKYPRTEKQDREKLEALGVDLIFAPDVSQIYPEGFSTSIQVTGITETLCGQSRPGHFSGVATIVTKLLLQAMPDIAIFGEKDFQQLLLIKQVVSDLNIPVKIMGGAIVRESDGLAMSSRNAYLSDKHRTLAPQIYKTLKATAKDLSSGTSPKKCLDTAKALLTDYGFKIDYLEVRDTKELLPLTGKIDRPARLFIACHLGKTRLIDNIKVIPPK
ncbi:MAG: pantoate--beta-alanine ligase [Methyloligellaceae bacterium]